MNKLKRRLKERNSAAKENFQKEIEQIVKKEYYYLSISFRLACSIVIVNMALRIPEYIITDVIFAHIVFSIRIIVITLIVAISYLIYFIKKDYNAALIFMFLGGSIFAIITILLTLYFVVVAIFNPTTSSSGLLFAAGLSWIGNVFAFATLYYTIDGGGPFKRLLATSNSGSSKEFDFGFPSFDNKKLWLPNYWDYVFLSFTLSTAFGPTDTPILTTKSKICTFFQATISLGILVILVAYAVNM